MAADSDLLLHFGHRILRRRSVPAAVHSWKVAANHSLGTIDSRQAAGQTHSLTAWPTLAMLARAVLALESSDCYHS